MIEIEKKILIIEDNNVNYFVLKKIFDILNFKSLRAENGNEAIKLCKQNSNIELIFLDIILPDINGVLLAKEIKKIIPKCKIIVNTSLSEDDNIKDENIDFVIYKPLKLEQIRNIINQI